MLLHNILQAGWYRRLSCVRSPRLGDLRKRQVRCSQFRPFTLQYPIPQSIFELANITRPCVTSQLRHCIIRNRVDATIILSAKSLHKMHRQSRNIFCSVPQAVRRRSPPWRVDGRDPDGIAPLPPFFADLVLVDTITRAPFCSRARSSRYCPPADNSSALSRNSVSMSVVRTRSRNKSKLFSRPIFVQRACMTDHKLLAVHRRSAHAAPEPPVPSRSPSPRVPVPCESAAPCVRSAAADAASPLRHPPARRPHPPLSRSGSSKQADGKQARVWPEVDMITLSIGKPHC